MVNNGGHILLDRSTNTFILGGPLEANREHALMMVSIVIYST